MFDSGLQTRPLKVGGKMDLHTFKDSLSVLLTDIDDTMTDEGTLGGAAYQALWRLKEANIQVIPVTGRPAGWCEMIARMWPVSGVIGENGAFYFRYDHKLKKMFRGFSSENSERMQNQKKLALIQEQILKEVPGVGIASDQFCRLFDLAVDFCEDVPPLPRDQVEKIKTIFESHGAVAKISSIHVNGWFGNYDKLSSSLTFLKNELRMTDAQIQRECGFAGDSPNDEPMWGYFQNSFAVANIQKFWNDLKNKPNYVCQEKGGAGFVELANQLIKNRNGTSL